MQANAQLRVVGTALAVMGFLVPSSRGGDDAGKAEVLPPPRIVVVEEPQPGTILPEPLPFLRTNRYDVWQAYSVDRQGYFRARVIQSPFGAYFEYNGKPYPWSTVVPLRQSPTIVR